MVEVVKSVDFCYGHTLPLHEGKCSQIHGHTGRLEVCVRGKRIKEEQSDMGMIIDFRNLKRFIQQVIDKVDHGFIFWGGDEREFLCKGRSDISVWIKTKDFIKSRNKVWLQLSEPPTAEVLSRWAYHQLRRELPAELDLMWVKWWESETSFAICDSLLDS